MNLIFFGNADFGSKTLLSLIESDKHKVNAIVVSKTITKSRKKNKNSNPIKTIALNHKIKLFEKDNLNDPNFITELKKIKSDVFIVIAFKLLPKEIFSIPKFGTINLHASLLPSYRGAAPIQKAIMNGDNETGLSTFFINEKIDKGKIIYQKKVKILKTDSFLELWTRLSNNGPDALKKTLDLIQKKQANIIKDINIKPSYAPKIKKSDLLINWKLDTSDIIHNKIRAFSPMPCMYTYFGKMRIKILKSFVTDINTQTKLPVGSIIIHDNQLLVNCIDKFLRIDILFPESKNKIISSEFVNGYKKEIESIKSFG